MLLLILLLVQPYCLQAEEHLTAAVRQFAEQGDPEAQFSMGLRYDLGDGVERDPAIAARWFTQAAAKGIAGACLYLGMKYEFGVGVEQNKVAAVNWYEQAARQGQPQAAFLLGSLYLKLPTPNPVRGCAWLIFVEEQGYPGAEETRQEGCRDLAGNDEKKVKALLMQLKTKMDSAK